jgi:hypothetical protein
MGQKSHRHRPWKSDRFTAQPQLIAQVIDDDGNPQGYLVIAISRFTLGRPQNDSADGEDRKSGYCQPGATGPANQ